MGKTKLILLLTLSTIISSCSIVGIHLKVENPKKAGKYPKETKQLMLLAADSKYRNCYDVYHNEIVVSVEIAQKKLVGLVNIAAIAVNDFDTLQVDLYKNMEVSGIECMNKKLAFRREEGAIFIQMPERIKKGDHFNFSITYSGKPIAAKRPPWDGGFVWKKDKNGKPWVGVACESEGSSLWWPSKDIMSDEADSTDITVIVPTGLMAVSNGVLKDSTHNNGTSGFHWHISYPINNYNVTMYVGDFKLLHDTYKSELTGKTTELNHYVLPFNYNKAAIHFQQVKKHIAFYEKMFGEYPWQRDGFKLVESPYAGMEHQSAIAYGNGYKNDNEGFDYIILHETAHEWWGNSVTAADLADGWIHEGFASYCEALYTESLFGKSSYENYMYFQRIMIMNKRPVVRKRGIRYFDYHDEDIYVKGSWVLHTLRNTLNDDPLFFDILKTFYQENVQKEILSEVFMETVNRKTGKDYNWFFKQYLFSREAPMLEFDRSEDKLMFRWSNTADDFVMPIKIKVQGKTIQLYPTTKFQYIDLDDTFDFYDNSLEQYYGMVQNKKLRKQLKNNR